MAETSGTLVARDDLVRPDGTIACSASTATNLTCVLTVKGTHKVFVADNAGDLTGGYAIAIQRLDAPTGCTAIAFGEAPVSATIAAAAEMDCYTFSGVVGDLIRFDVAPTSGTLNSTKEFIRPDGTTLCPPFDSGGCRLDVTGTHSIIVSDFQGAGTGNYVIAIQRMNDPVGCTALTFGAAPIAGSAGPGEMNCFTFAGSAGDTDTLRLVHTSGTAAFVDFNGPNGTFLCSTSVQSSTNLTCTLNSIGTHTIVVDSGGSGFTAYTAALQRLNGPGGCTALIFGGASTSAAVSSVGEMDCYTFDAAAGDQIRIRTFETSGQLQAATEMVGPDGGSVDCNHSSPTDAVQTCGVDTTGTQAIVIFDGSLFSGARTGSYALAIQRLNDPVGCTALTFGAAPVDGTIAAAAEMDCYTFNAGAGSLVQISLPETSGTLQDEGWVFDPSGNLECFANGECQIEATGTHSIIVDDSSGLHTGDYALAIQRLTNPPAGTCTSLVFGAAPTAATIGAPGEMDCFTISGSNGSQVRVRLVATSGTLVGAADIARPDSTLVCPESTALDVTCPLDVTGAHHIIVNDASFGPGTGGYSIAVQRLNAPIGCVTLSFGAAPVNATIAVPVEMDCYAFTGAAGDRIRLRVVESGALVPHAEFLRPVGTTACSGPDQFTDDLSCRLDTGGTWRILLDDTTGTKTDGYSIVIQRLNGPVGCSALTFGATPTAATISATGELDCFTLSAVGGDAVQVRAAPTSGTLGPQAELVRPNGSTVSTFCDFSCVVNTTGTYSVIVEDSAGSGTGDYAVAVQRRNNPVGCTAISFGAAPTTGSVGPAETDCYTFTGALGSRARVDMVQTGGAGSVGSVLLAPTGSTVCFTDLVFSCKVTTAGTQAVFVSANGGGAGDYSLSVQRLNDPVGCVAPAFGTPVTAGSIDAPAENDCFTFSGALGDVIEIRATVTSGTLAGLLSVVRPNGTVVCQGLMVEILTCDLDATGTHSLLVADESGTGTGGYNLEVQRLDGPMGCTSIAVGDPPTPGSIDAAAEFDCFTLQVQAGRTVTIQLAETSGSLVGQMELVGPNGWIRCGLTTAAQLSCKADTTGTYTLLVGDSTETQTGGYTVSRTS